MEISGTSALVTGGASGLGLATVTALVKSGARVIALDRPSANRDALDAVGGTVEFAAANVTDEDSVTEAVKLANRDGQLRIVVNCAGIGNAIKTVSKNGPFPLDYFEKIVKVNLIGTFNVIRLAAHSMSQNEPWARNAVSLSIPPPWRHSTDRSDRPHIPHRKAVWSVLRCRSPAIWRPCRSAS